MIPIEDQVCSLELARKLKQLGVKQESYFYHCRESINVKTGEERWELWALMHNLTNMPEYYVSAFTVPEAFAWLPICCSLTKEPSGYQCIYNDTYDFFEDMNPANAVCKMLAYLIESGVVKVGDL